MKSSNCTLAVVSASLYGDLAPCPSRLKRAGPNDPGGQVPLGLQPITASSLSLARSQAAQLSRSRSKTLAAKDGLHF